MEGKDEKYGVYVGGEKVAEVTADKANIHPVKILILSPVFGRTKIVKDYIRRWHIAIEKIKEKHYIEFEVVLIIDRVKDFEPLQYSKAGKLLQRGGETLAQKKNKAIRDVLNGYDFDYLMELDSTGLFAPELFDRYAEEIRRGNKFFGINNIAFHEKETDRLLDYSILNGGVWVSGRLIKREIVETTVARLGGLWSPELYNGLGVNQENRIFEATDNRVTIITTKDKEGNPTPYVYDLKTGQDVTPFQTLADHKKESKEIKEEIQKKVYLNLFNLL